MKEPKVSIAIPVSIIADVPSLQLKTYKIGQIARASAIYCIDEIFIYADCRYSEQKKDSLLICEILRYMETPQYLRRTLFPLSPELRYAGILPPLNTPHHPTESRLAFIKDGEYREGVVVKSDRNGSLVDVGVERPLKASESISPGKRRTFRVFKASKDEALLELADSSAINEYWGYKVVELRGPLGEFMRRRTHDLYILTSRLGLQIANSLKEVQERLQRSRKILIAFGSPREGLRGILAKEGLDEEAGDFNLNTIPGQGTSSVRTEEAVQATLAIINLLIRKMDARFIRATNNDHTTPQDM
jgi:predicted SPOUT superfamily RNA methylase MTH1